MPGVLPEKQRVVLSLLGHCPSHKNQWKRSRRGMYTDDEVAAQVGGLISQARSQWQRKPVIHPDVAIQFYVASRRQDRDNMAQTIIDVLRHAGVVKNDNIASFNGFLGVPPAIVVKAYERTVVEIAW